MLRLSSCYNAQFDSRRFFRPLALPLISIDSTTTPFGLITLPDTYHIAFNLNQLMSSTVVAQNPVMPIAVVQSYNLSNNYFIELSLSTPLSGLWFLGTFFTEINGVVSFLVIDFIFITSRMIVVSAYYFNFISDRASTVCGYIEMEGHIWFMCTGWGC